MLNRPVEYLRASFPRAVGFLLVVFILYGTTAEAVHRHGRLLSSTDSTNSSITTEQPAEFRVGKGKCVDCLICQLQQNFAAGLISVRATGTTTSVLEKSALEFPKKILSQVSSPRSSRAPPFTS